jgi:hypothetical protein
MTAKTKKPDAMTHVVEQTEARTAFWMEEASIEEILMALFHEADEVTFRYELVTHADGAEQGRYRVQAFRHAGPGAHAFDVGAMSTDPHSTNIFDPFSEVLCAVLAAGGPRSMWSDWWMETHQGQRVEEEATA